jgi:hypothetical protein
LNFRGRAETQEKKDYRGELFDSADVIVPAESVKWFMARPAKYTARRTAIVFVRIKFVKDALIAELLGREMKTDIKGSRIVW